MSLTNPNINDIVATTIEFRSKDIADNVSANNAVLRNIKSVATDGGYEIRETINTQENSNAGSYSGADQLPIAATDGFTAAQYQWAQYAVPVTFTGREMMMNSGRQQLIDLVAARVSLAETTMKNMLNRHIYLDGTGNNGKNLTGLGAAVPLVNTSGVYGGIDRSAITMWQNKKYQASVDGGGVATSATLLAQWNAFYLQLTRGTDVPKMIIASPSVYAMFQNSLQAQQRYSSADSANAGFATLQFKGTPVIFESTASGIGSNVAYFLNSDYLRLRFHKERNMVTLDKKGSINQDAWVQNLLWMGNLTCSGSQFQGIYSNT